MLALLQSIQISVNRMLALSHLLALSSMKVCGSIFYSFVHVTKKIHRKNPYFLKYSPGLELNPVSNWTQVNLAIQSEKF